MGGEACDDCSTCIGSELYASRSCYHAVLGLTRTARLRRHWAMTPTASSRITGASDSAPLYTNVALKPV